MSSKLWIVLATLWSVAGCRAVAFVLHADDLAFYGPDLRRIVKPGTFTAFVRHTSSWSTETPPAISRRR